MSSPETVTSTPLEEAGNWIQKTARASITAASEGLAAANEALVISPVKETGKFLDATGKETTKLLDATGQQLADVTNNITAELDGSAEKKRKQSRRSLSEESEIAKQPEKKAVKTELAPKSSLKMLLMLAPLVLLAAYLLGAFASPEPVVEVKKGLLANLMLSKK